MAFRAKGRSAGKVLLTLKKETHKKIIIIFFLPMKHHLEQGSPASRPRTGTGLEPVRN